MGFSIGGLATQGFANVLSNPAGAISTGVNALKSLYNVGQAYRFNTSPIGQYYNEYSALNNAAASTGYGAAPKVYAPFWDTDAVVGASRAKAEQKFDMSNPQSYYAQELARYRAENERQKAAKQEQWNLENKFLDTAMADYSQRQQVEQQRLAADTEAGISNLGQQYQFNQAQAGTEKEYTLQSMRDDIAAGNLTTSGIGRQRLGQLVSSSNVQDQQLEQQYEAERQQLQTYKTRTFQDIAAERASKEREVKEGKERLDVDLKNTMAELVYDLQEEEWDVEEKRQAAILQATQQENQVAFAQQLASITDPAQREAFVQTYGSAF